MKEEEDGGNEEVRNVELGKHEVKEKMEEEEEEKGRK